MHFKSPCNNHIKHKIQMIPTMYNYSKAKSNFSDNPHGSIPVLLEGINISCGSKHISTKLGMAIHCCITLWACLPAEGTN